MKLNPTTLLPGRTFPCLLKQSRRPSRHHRAWRLCFPALVALALLLGALNAEASHFRGASLTWKRLPTPANPPNTIEATITESWRSDFIDSNTYNWGDNTFFNTVVGPAGASVIASGPGFTVIRRVVTHTYLTEGPYTINASGCCRISTLVNAADQNWFLSSVVDLRSGNQGSPVITSPVILQMIRGGLNTVPLAFVDVDGDPVTFRMATAAESGIPTIPQAGGKTLSVSPAGVLTWDTSSTTVGQLFAAQVVATDNHVLSPSGAGASRVQFDFVIQIVDGTLNRPPVAAGNGGPFVATIGQPFTNTIVGTDPDGGNLTVTHQGLPPGASLTPASGTSGPQPLSATFSWTPTLAQADSSFGITLLFTDAGGLQASKSFAISVPSNQPPVAYAGPDQSVFDINPNGTPTTVSLSASGSYDPENVPLTYSWTPAPGQIPVTLANGNTATPTFIAPSLHSHAGGEPVPINLLFRLDVSDGKSVRSDDVLITVKHRNLSPTAVATVPDFVSEASLVTLDGSASSDPDHDPLSYTWSQSSGPAVSLAPNGTNNPTISFSHVINAPHSHPGELLEFILTVSDGIETSNSTLLPIFVKNINQAPVSLAGHTHPVFDTDHHTHLDGYGYDVDGDPVSLLWTQIAGPTASIDDPTAEEPEITLPAVSVEDGSATLTFKLTVSDANSPSDPDALTSESTVDLIVKHGNRAPVASAGAGQTAPELTQVTLDGSGSFDPESDPLSYSWTQIGGINVTLDTTDPARPTFTTPDVSAAGSTLTFSLVASDGSLSSQASLVTVTVNYVNRMPAVSAIAPQTSNEGSVVTLHASANDPDGNPLTYTWDYVSGLSVTLDTTDPSNPTFTAPQVPQGGGQSIYKVTVSDGFPGGTASTTAVVNITNINNPPVADAGSAQSVPEGTAVSLEGSFSSDVDGEILTYHWQQTAGPAVALSDIYAAQPTFTAPLVSAGGNPNASATLTFALVVNDGQLNSTADSVDVKVSNVDHAPIADAGGSVSYGEATEVALNATASSDPDGDPLTYSWVQTAGAPVILAGPTTAEPTFTTPFVSVADAALTFEVTVKDPFGGADTDTIQIAIVNRNTPPVASSASASMATLWPPNHAMVPISILGIQDPDNNNMIVITGVTQDEPTNGLGDGDTAIDAIINADGTALLRAERSGKGDGRVYRVSFITSDLEGSASGVVKVTVPHANKKPAIENAVTVDSTR